MMNHHQVVGAEEVKYPLRSRLCSVEFWELVAVSQVHHPRVVVEIRKQEPGVIIC